jgi:hypothetical protein
MNQVVNDILPVLHRHSLPGPGETANVELPNGEHDYAHLALSAIFDPSLLLSQYLLLSIFLSRLTLIPPCLLCCRFPRAALSVSAAVDLPVSCAVNLSLLLSQCLLLLIYLSLLTLIPPCLLCCQSLPAALSVFAADNLFLRSCSHVYGRINHSSGGPSQLCSPKLAGGYGSHQPPAGSGAAQYCGELWFGDRLLYAPDEYALARVCCHAIRAPSTVHLCQPASPQHVHACPGPARLPVALAARLHPHSAPTSARLCVRANALYDRSARVAHAGALNGFARSTAWLILLAARSSHAHKRDHRHRPRQEQVRLCIRPSWPVLTTRAHRVTSSTDDLASIPGELVVELTNALKMRSPLTGEEVRIFELLSDLDSFWSADCSSLCALLPAHLWRLPKFCACAQWKERLQS